MPECPSLRHAVRIVVHDVLGVRRLCQQSSMPWVPPTLVHTHEMASLPNMYKEQPSGALLWGKEGSHHLFIINTEQYPVPTARLAQTSLLYITSQHPPT